MKGSIYVIAVLSAFSYCCTGTDKTIHSEEDITEKTVYPAGNIEEIRIYGTYIAEDPQRLEKLIKTLIRYGRIKNRKEFKEKYPHFLDEGDERMNDYITFNYCYNKISGKKEPHFNKNLRARLYDREENIIAEDYLRATGFDETENVFSIVSYLPYLKDGYFIQIVRLEGSKEVILWEPGKRGTAVISKEELIELSKPLTPRRENLYKYDSEAQCHNDNFKIR